MSSPVAASMTVHVLASVGWFGAVVVFLILAVAAALSDDPVLVSAVPAVMAWAGTWVLVPFAVAALGTGLVESVLSRWGLLQHWWVVFKLTLTVAGLLVLVAYTRTLTALADAASFGEPVSMVSVVLHATLALLLLGVTTVLAVFKPRGRTRYGQRRARAGAGVTGERAVE